MPTTSTDRLRFVLQANATFSFVGGAIFLVAGSWLSEQLGIDHVLITRLLGAGLILFAGDVFFVSRRAEPKLLMESALVSAGDFTWVAATVVVLLTGILSTAGGHRRLGRRARRRRLRSVSALVPLEGPRP